MNFRILFCKRLTFYFLPFFFGSKENPVVKDWVCLFFWPLCFPFFFFQWWQDGGVVWNSFFDADVILQWFRKGNIYMMPSSLPTAIYVQNLSFFMSHFCSFLKIWVFQTFSLKQSFDYLFKKKKVINCESHPS